MPVQARPLIAPVERTQIEQQQRGLLEQEQRQREALQNQLVIAPTAQEENRSKLGYCQTIQHIELHGSTLLAASVQRALFTPFLHRCLSLSDMQHLARSVTQAYLERGFITSQAWLPPQNVADGRLMIAVSEGRIETITQAGKTPLALRLAFPTSAGHVLNLRDLEQGLEQLNRLATHPVTLNIQPGDQPGYSHVLVIPDAQPRLPLHLSLSANNGGQTRSSHGQLNAALTVDNPLQLADQWQLSATQDHNPQQNQYSRSLAGGVSLPYGYWRLSYQTTWSDFYQDFVLYGNRWQYRGTTQSQRLAASRTLWRDNNQTGGLDIALTRRRTDNRIAQQRLDTHSAQVNHLSLSPQYSRRLGNGYATVSLVLSQGLRGMGATRDNPAYPHAPRAQFRKWSLHSSYLYPLTPTLHYLTSVYAQTSSDNLYASERIVIGGQFSVRGFSAPYLSANRGGFWRNELNWQFAQRPLAGTLTLTAALDGGSAQKQPGRANGGQMAGAALGLGHVWRGFNQSLMLGKPLAYPGDQRPDHWVTYWQATVTL